jgi:hypothetical protein
MLPHAYATGGAAFPDVIQLLLDTHMDSALTMYGKCSVQVDQSAELGQQDRPVIASPASIWTRSTILSVRRVRNNLQAAKTLIPRKRHGHAADMPPPIGAAYLPRRRFPVTRGAAPKPRFEVVCFRTSKRGHLRSSKPGFEHRRMNVREMKKRGSVSPPCTVTVPAVPAVDRTAMRRKLELAVAFRRTATRSPVVLWVPQRLHCRRFYAPLFLLALWRRRLCCRCNEVVGRQDLLLRKRLIE